MKQNSTYYHLYHAQRAGWGSMLFFMLCLTSCSSGVLTQEELVAYVQDEKNGVSKKKVLGKTEIGLEYRPSDMIARQDLANKENPTPEETEQAKANFQKGLYFTLHLSKNGEELEMGALSSQEEFAKRIQQLSFGMRERILVRTSTNDSVPLLDYVYPRMYGMTGKTSMLLVFDRAQATQGEWLDVIINGYDLGVGVNKFRFQVKDIEKVPELDFKI